MNFGCLKEIPSVRTYSYEAVCGKSTADVPSRYILPSDRLPAVTNQGTTWACVAFALAEILSVFNLDEFGKLERFSEGFIYGYNRDASYKGMYPQKTIDLMRKTGSVPLKYFDKLYEMPELREDLLANPNLAKLVEIAQKYKIKGYVGFLRGEIEEVKQALFTSQTPIFAVSPNYFGGSHAIIIVGWEKDGWVIQNSWGKNWGENGRKCIPYSEVSQKYLITDEVFELKFADVDKSKWYYDAVKEAVFNGLMQGTSAETFEPDRPITRAELAQVCVNICKKLDDVLALNNG